MIPIKVQCNCVQRYGFEVEPVNGRMPSAVACPVCGADGTDAANAAIAQSLLAHSAPAPVAVPVAAAPVRVPPPARAIHLAPPAAAPRPAARPTTTVLHGQIDRTQAEHEARAKISWGDPPEEVLKYLMIHQFSYEEASNLVREMFKERLATIRGNGIKKICFGVFLMGVPIAAWFIFMAMGVISLKLFAITIIVGFWGVWLVIKGTTMVFAPKAEAGDVVEQ